MFILRELYRLYLKAYIKFYESFFIRHSRIKCYFDEETRCVHISYHVRHYFINRKIEIDMSFYEFKLFFPTIQNLSDKVNKSYNSDLDEKSVIKQPQNSSLF